MTKIPPHSLRPAASSLTVCVLALALHGCGAKNQADSKTAATPAAPATTPSGATLANAGALFSGQNAAAIRDYLRTVVDVKPAVFAVEWSPDTVAVSREAAMRSLRSITPDGRIYRLSTAEPAMAQLKVGSILWIWDIAIRRVDRITFEDDVTVVHTKPVALNEAMKQARIEFDSQVNLANHYVSYAPRDRPPAHTARRHRATGFVLVSDSSEGESSPNDATQESAPPDAAQTNADDPDGGDRSSEVQQTHGAWTGNLKGFDYSVSYVAQPSGTVLTLEASNSAGGEPSPDDQSNELNDKVKEQAKEASDEEEKAKDDARKAQHQVDELQEDLHTLEDSYERQVQQLKADDAERTSPRPDGPTPPSKPTDSYGMPLTLKATIDRATQQYDSQRSVELTKIHEILKVRNDAQARAMADQEKQDRVATLGKVAKGLFDIAKDNLDVRFKARVDMNNFAVAGTMSVKDGNMQAASAQFKQVKGKLDLSFIGRWANPGNGMIKVPALHLPVAYTVPVPVDGVPFVVQLGADFLMNVFLSGKNATQSFNGTFAFDASGGIHSTGSSTTGDGTMEGGAPQINQQEALSLGPSGLVLAVKVPHLGFGLGMLDMSSVAYLNVVTALTISNGSALSIGLMPPCKRVAMSTTGFVGISTTFIPWPSAATGTINDMLSTAPKQIFEKKAVLTDPDSKACEVDSV